MTVRRLPQTEWARLDGTEIAPLLPCLQPGAVDVMVVEDGDQLLACWGVVRMVHLEGVWLAPEIRRTKAGWRAWQALKAATLSQARLTGAPFAMTGAVTPDTVSLLTKELHAREVPMQTFVVPLTEGLCLPQL